MVWYSICWSTFQLVDHTQNEKKTLQCEICKLSVNSAQTKFHKNWSQFGGLTQKLIESWFSLGVTACIQFLVYQATYIQKVMASIFGIILDFPHLCIFLNPICIFGLVLLALEKCHNQTTSSCICQYKSRRLCGPS